jgi:hypothetical protein
VFGVLRSILLAQLSGSGYGPAREGSDIAEWADSPERLALVWIVGGVILIAVVVLLVKMKMDKD